VARFPPVPLLPAAVLILACTGGGDRIILATTSSAYDSGLLTVLGDAWDAGEAPPRLHVLVTGSGEALELGRRGDADVLLVHAPDAEIAFMAAGHGTLRLPVMRNDYVLVGPAADPAGVRLVAGPAAAFRRISDTATFISRGDDSGTHQRELQLRILSGLPVPAPRGTRYSEAGQGMAETLRMAAERGAYTLSDRASWEVLRGGLDLVAFTFDDPLLDNPYSVIVSAASTRAAAAQRFAQWLASGRAQELIADVRNADGVPLFRPAATAEPAAGR
jgi:tungstate transport system substrate-binding protein